MTIERLLSIGDVADVLGVSINTIYAWRATGHGPRAAKIGKHLRFRKSDVEAYIDACAGGPGRDAYNVGPPAPSARTNGARA